MMGAAVGIVASGRSEELVAGGAGPSPKASGGDGAVAGGIGPGTGSDAIVAIGGESVDTCEDEVDEDEDEDDEEGEDTADWEGVP
jgi:hypothetical protein